MDLGAEWLESDGLGGFASSTVGGIRTRRYHALLLCATTPPTGRTVLVNGFDACVVLGRETAALSAQAYLPGVVSPDGASRLERFEPEPWPRWTFRLPDGRRVEHELFASLLEWSGAVSEGMPPSGRRRRHPRRLQRRVRDRRGRGRPAARRGP